MANRMLRPWTHSDKVDQLSAEAERFFTRLIMVADDYGSYYAGPRLLNSGLFPMKKLSDVKVAEWLDECLTVGLLIKYDVGGKSFIRIVDFNQRLQNKRNKFPDPLPVNSQKVTVSHGESPPELEVELEVENEPELEPAEAVVSVWPSFEDFWNLYDKKQDRPKCEKLWKKIDQLAREQIMLHLADYVKATPEKRYRKNPQTYLNGKCWTDEIIERNGKSATNGAQHPAVALAEDFSRRVGSPPSG